MKDVLVRTGSSVLAAIIVYIALTLFAAPWGTWTRLLVALGVGALAFGIAVWAASGEAKDKAAAADVASNLKGGSVTIKDVTAEIDPGQKVRVASDIESTGHVDISGASLKTRDKTN